MPRLPRKIKKLEQHFIARSEAAFTRAARRARDAGLHVVVAEQGTLYDVAPDGVRTVLKHITPPTPVKRGMRVRIQ